VSRGDTLAFVGSTGRSTGPHVHFEVLKDGRQIDPLTFIGR
jgi:murein DD-endopeptidase MepM/ murein hydrolase activator NlpD